MKQQSLFHFEEKAIADAERLLSTEECKKTVPANHYQDLLKRYRKLFRQVISLVKMSDRMQQDLNLLTEELHQLATTDGLTGLTNRREFMDIARREFSRAKRHESDLSLILMDIDHFKQVNDTYGHDVGDEVLKVLAKSGAGVIRDHDIFCRFGGEEFTVLLPGTDLKGAIAMAERLRVLLAQTSVPFEGGAVQFTISAGISTVNPGMNTIETLIKQADLSLYEAKSRGRNCIRVYETS